uniref:MADF domain-containing protein n=1 Tax=Anopheles dirus TaxID=7168 RepID=A0A182N3X9_9DIPT
MGDLRLFSRGFTKELIELYKSFPCLWDAKAQDYQDRTKRNKAYDALVAKYREVDRAPTKDKVKKKLYALRSCYLRELGKLKKSIRTSTTVEEVYKPTLWYFYLFDFLTDHETMKEPTSTTDEYLDGAKEEEVEYEEEVIHEDYVELEEETADDDSHDDANIEEAGYSAHDHKEDALDPFGTNSQPQRSCTRTRSHSIATPSSSRSHAPTQPKRRKPQHSPPLERQERIEHSGLAAVETKSRTNAQHRDCVEDQFDVYGKLIAHKLRSFDKLQVTFSQRLINEILYEAEMGFLTRNSKLVDLGESP